MISSPSSTSPPFFPGIASPIVTMPILKVFVAPMFAGKSSFLLLELEKVSSVYGGPSVCLLHSFDSRPSLTEGSEGVSASTHSKVARMGASSILTHRVSSLSEVEEMICKEVVAIGIDEAQFFDGEDLYNTVLKWVSSYPLQFPSLKYVFVCGLDGDARQVPFKGSGLLSLVSIADEFVKMNAVCIKCAQKGHVARAAPFTIRKFLYEVDFDPNKANVGGDEAYEAVCRFHASESPLSIFHTKKI